ncbi:MAG: leucine-rich repeat domain-containing protein [Flavobacteriales bacterium]|nr:leucine-rich repeat domain-containing protein [Flavobacteriales bacterium]
MRRLEVLIISDFPTDTIDPIIFEIPNLKRLEFSGCSSSHAPNSIPLMESVTEIWIDHGSLQPIPDFFRSFPNLEIFECSETPTTELPPSFFDLKNIIKIGVYRCPLNKDTLLKIDQAFPEADVSYDPKVPSVPIPKNK